MPGSINKEEYYSAEHQEMLWSIGLAAGVLFTGGLIVLGISCLFLLSSKSGGSAKQRRLLQVYVIVLILAVLFHETTFFLTVNIVGAFQPESKKELDKVTKALAVCLDLSPVIIVCMADGLFVSLLMLLIFRASTNQ